MAPHFLCNGHDNSRFLNFSHLYLSFSYFLFCVSAGFCFPSCLYFLVLRWLFVRVKIGFVELQGLADGLRVGIDDMQGRVDGLRGEIFDLQRLVDELRGGLADLQGRVDELRGGFTFC